MKKLKISLIITLIALAVSGCGKDTLETTEVEKETEVIEKIEVKSQAISEEIAALTEVTSYVGDTDGDGADETVVLATSAQRSNKGEFLWNDGQNWALYVKDRDDAYILLDDYVQAGNVYFEVSDYYMKDGIVPKISVTISTGAGFAVKNYTFDKEKFSYIEDVVFDTQKITEGGINRRFSSFPNIVE